MTRAEMLQFGWNELDILLVSGDAYVDHPSFGIALLGRFLVAAGFKVGIVAQPPWENRQEGLEAIQCMGRPRLFTGISAGAIDSMLAHYTAFRKKRHDDAYTPGGQAGARPNRATILYTALVRQAFPGMPIVLGGIEASLRRASHYDFWTDSLRRSILFDSKADIISYGMGESTLLALAQQADTQQKRQPKAQLDRKTFVASCANLKGLAYICSTDEAQALLSNTKHVHTLPAHSDILAEPHRLMDATLALERYTHRGNTTFIQYTEGRALVITPPSPPLPEQDLDALYGLPFTRLPHPSYTAPIPAWEMIRTSITTHRGCAGGCSFCSLALHQGRRITSRSRQSILDEAQRIAIGPNPERPAPRWAGSISDVGGPSANMWQASCTAPKECARASCLHPRVCPFFLVDQQAGVALLQSVAKTPGVRHVRIASGVRFDLALLDHKALYAYTSEFTGGQLKVAPEHCVPHVLNLMRKPGIDLFETFLEVFASSAKKSCKEVYTVPYLLSAFPGCSLQDMQRLRDWLQRKNWSPQQVQCFIPTPGTVATAMFYSNIAPDGQPLYVAKSDKERMQQHHALTHSPPRFQRKKHPIKSGQRILSKTKSSVIQNKASK